jgi:hypothetical protein
LAATAAAAVKCKIVFSFLLWEFPTLVSSSSPGVVDGPGRSQ